MAHEDADFSGWATKNDVLCTDGKTIKHGSFTHQDGMKIPMVYQHQHKGVDNVLGHAFLEDRPEGVYTYAYFNGTPNGLAAKETVIHGDLTMLSIFANKLRLRGSNVMHGDIKELSLVISGANSEARIENVRLVHGDGEYEDIDDEAVIYTGEELVLNHADGASTDTSGSTKTLADIYDSMTPEQQKLVDGLVGQALESNGGTLGHSEVDPEGDDTDETEVDPEVVPEVTDETDTETDPASEDVSEDKNLEHQDKEGTDMSRNLFDQTTTTDGPTGATLTHDQLMTIVSDAKKDGSLKDSFLSHAEEYGITNIELLFPEAKTLDSRPEWITRKMEWVNRVLAGTRKVPWSRIKSMSADLTHEEARAKGYIKATMKKEQFFELKGRETGPKTIYKKQKLDRDDMVDITELDVVAWIWQEMRFMLNEEIARAILIGDGREVDDPDKIDETKIRPIATDDPFYTDVVLVAANVTEDALIEAVLRARGRYKGAGNPSAYMTEDSLTDLLLIKDRLNRRMYADVAAVASALRVSEIITVPVMDGARTNDGEILMVLVNLSDYTVGTTKGGEINTFEDFDIDYNQNKYLIEGRMSGALTKHKTAQVVVRTNGTLIVVTSAVPTFDAETGALVIPTVAGVSYVNRETDAVLVGTVTVAAGTSIDVVAKAATGYYFPHNFDADWIFAANV